MYMCIYIYIEREREREKKKERETIERQRERERGFFQTEALQKDSFSGFYCLFKRFLGDLVVRLIFLGFDKGVFSSRASGA